MTNLPSPPSSPYGNLRALTRGVISLAVAGLSEVLMRPIIPWTYVPGSILVILGLGVATALFNRSYVKFGLGAYYAATIGVVIWASLTGTSFFPVFLYMGTFHLTQWALSLAIEL